MSIVRRSLLVLAALTLAAPSWALNVQPYSASALAAAQGAGRPVVLHFHADWCPTCRAQDKSLDALKAEPGLDVTVLRVDYDKETELNRALKVRTQSTLIAYHGASERARLVGQTDVDAVRKLLKSAL